MSLTFSPKDSQERQRLQKLFTKTGRVVVENFLDESASATAEQYLLSLEEWNVSYLKIERNLPGGEDKPLISNSQGGSLDMGGIYLKARHGFQYFYSSCRLFDGSSPRLFSSEQARALAEVVVGNDNFNKFCSEICGVDSAEVIDGHFAKYEAGNFLNSHTDQNSPGSFVPRKIAFVLNLSRGWCPDWGGLTMFWNRDSSTAEAIVPKFNSLMLFSVPRLHSVTSVAPFVTIPRLSLAGWLG